MDGAMNQDRPIGSCGRARLLLSLEADGAATPAQRAELEAHLPRCEDCRGAAAADRAVRARIAARAGLGTPAWSAGFAERTARIAVRERREARLQNRLLWACAAAAVVVAA